MALRVEWVNLNDWGDWKAQNPGLEYTISWPASEPSPVVTIMTPDRDPRPVPPPNPIQKGMSRRVYRVK